MAAITQVGLGGSQAAYPGFTPKTETVFYVAPNHVLHIGPRNNTLVVPPRTNTLTHDF